MSGEQPLFGGLIAAFPIVFGFIPMVRLSLLSWRRPQRYKTIKNRKQKTNETVTLDAVEFIRRYLLHVVPKGFVRIRHYGFMANRYKKKEHFNPPDSTGAEAGSADGGQKNGD